MARYRRFSFQFQGSARSLVAEHTGRDRGALNGNESESESLWSTISCNNFSDFQASQDLSIREKAMRRSGTRDQFYPGERI
jgi:hypothetical protein